MPLPPPWPPKPQVLRVRGFGARLKGVHGLVDGLGDPVHPRALVLQPCNAVHTLGLRAPIDVVFLGRGNRILRHVAALPPNRCAVALRARAVVELPAGYCSGASWSSVLLAALADSKIIT